MKKSIFTIFFLAISMIHASGKGENKGSLIQPSRFTAIVALIYKNSKDDSTPSTIYSMLNSENKVPLTVDFSRDKSNQVRFIRQSSSGKIFVSVRVDGAIQFNVEVKFPNNSNLADRASHV